MPKHIQNFCASFILAIVLPLVPLIMDVWHHQKLQVDVVTLTASMYAVSIAMSSNNGAIFGVGLIVSVIFAMAYGMSLASSTSLTGAAEWAMVAIAAMILMHGIERFGRHVLKREPFFSF